MTEFEQVADSMKKLAEAMYEAATAICNWGVSIIKNFFETLDTETIIEAAAYIKAKKEHPEWVHKAEYNKKKRIRKKYHDRIMRKYGSANNGQV